jgi:S1-C subfamily serine protease
MSKNEEANPLVSLSESMADAVAKAGAATVSVDARQRMPASGIVFSSELVLTADHVVEREEDISVILADGKKIPAKVAGRDPGNDLALLRLNGASLAPAEITSQPARIGQLVLALGRPSDEGIQASLGVISAMGGPVRTGGGGLLEQYLRTDTIPYPGFSGGPLIDTSGQVVGLNTSGLAHGLSLTIPASLAWQVADMLAKHGSIKRGFLGIRSQPVQITALLQKTLGREQAVGLLLVGVEEQSPAAQGGLMVGDILVGLNGEVIADPDELLVRLNGTVVGKLTPVEVLRGGQPITLQVKIGERK